MAATNTNCLVGALVACIILLVLSLNISRGGRMPSRNEFVNSMPTLTSWVQDESAHEELEALRARVRSLELRLNAKFTAPDTAAASALQPATTVAPRAAAVVEAPRRTAPTPIPAAAAAEEEAEEPPPGLTAAHVSRALAYEVDEERKAPAVADGVVPLASWWSDREVSRYAPPGGAPREWCRKPPPCAAPKPELPSVAPPSEKPRLTTELAKAHASKDNLLIVTYVNANRLDFVYTFVKHLIALGQRHYLIGALDEKALRGLQAHGIPCFFMDSGLTTNDYGWGTYAFRQLGLHKVQLVLDLAKTGVDALTVDADAFVLRDPAAYFNALPDADVLMSSDHLTATNGYDDEGLEGPGGFHSAFNIGYIFIRARAIEFVQEWRDTCYKRSNDWDQVLFANVLRRGGGGARNGKARADRLMPMYKTSEGRNLMAGVLPVSLFASGHTFFVSRMAHIMHREPYMVHTTFQYGGAQGKRHRLREGLFWEDDAEYYNGPDFLSFEPDLPYKLVYPKGGAVRPDGTQEFAKRASVDQHFALVHHQLTQIRNALALAQELGRILILPRLVCGLDRWWAPHSGIIPGSAARLPLLECPADHVIDLERMGKPETVLREAGFLCNPRTPLAVLKSSATEAVPAAVDDGRSYVRGLSTKHKGTKVLKLDKPPPDYRATLPPAKVAEFERRVSSYGGLWCCNHPPGGRGPGHIWYDFLWDVVPHRDRHNRKWDGQWTPKMGP